MKKYQIEMQLLSLDLRQNTIEEDTTIGDSDLVGERPWPLNSHRDAISRNGSKIAIKTVHKSTHYRVKVSSS
jgi:hypothetical protein